MRLFWSLVLTGGLLLIGLDVYDSRQERRAARTNATGGAVSMAEDGTGFPPTGPTPPPH